MKIHLNRLQERDKRKFVAWMSADCGITNITTLDTSHLLNCLKAFLIDKETINPKILELNKGLTIEDIMRGMIFELLYRDGTGLKREVV